MVWEFECVSVEKGEKASSPPCGKEECLQGHYNKPGILLFTNMRAFTFDKARNKMCVHFQKMRATKCTHSLLKKNARTGRHRQTQTDTDTDTDRHRQTQTDTDTDTDTQTHTDTH